ncbi:DUF1918 domain-containing protein [Streptomyces sp. NPDC052496]|uniref:DUF1918 domain-containing protein n=1 Tax=Streptomyces sp. NPDC052496 TaxID=3154951 RepID=UPI00344947D9
MHAKIGDRLVVGDQTGSGSGREVQIIEVLGNQGEPPYRVRFEDGREAVLSPGPGSVIRRSGTASN